MRGLWLERGEIRYRENLPRPDPELGEARVRVRLAGICNTDLELTRGYASFTGVPGHEFVGVVEEVPPPSGNSGRGTRELGAPSGNAADPDLAPAGCELLGRRVVGEINVGCGVCATCRRVSVRHCPERSVLGIRGRPGAFAEHLRLPLSNLHPVPDGVSDEAALFTEPLAAALQIQERVPVRPADRVLVVGDGKLGLLAAQVLTLSGCELTLVGRHREHLEILGRFGADTRLASRPEDRESDGPASDPPPPAGRFDVAIEATGNPGGFEIARRALRPRGTLVLKSTYAGRLEIDASALVVGELSVVGSRCGPFPPALRHLRAGRLDLVPLLQDRFPLERGRAAFRRAAERGVLKVALEVDAEGREAGDEIGIDVG